MRGEVASSIWLRFLVLGMGWNSKRKRRRWRGGGEKVEGRWRGGGGGGWEVERSAQAQLVRPWLQPAAASDEP